MLTFVIPTRKRPRELALAIKSIAEQVESGVTIKILYNRQEEDTRRTISRACEKWPFITSIGVEGDPEYSDKFKLMFQTPIESEWVWTFGDDDILRPEALKFILQRLKDAKPELSFIHVAEKKRSANTGHTFTGRLIDLCCKFGWIEMTGFISGNIMRAEFFRKLIVPSWQLYANSAFVHSCVLLEVLLTEQAQFIDQALIDTQTETQTDECLARWTEEHIQDRYFYVAQAIKDMMDRGLIKKKLPIKFFRYMNYHLWDRHLTFYIAGWVNSGGIWRDGWEEHVKLLTELIDDEETAKSVRDDIDNAVKLVKAHALIKEHYVKVETDLKAIYERRRTPPYPYTFIEPLAEAA